MENSDPSTAVEVTDEDRRKAAEMLRDAYDDRPTAVLPGSHNTVTGTAINDWLDEDGNSKFGKDPGSENPVPETPVSDD